MHRPQSPRNAFTLVELLVVIAIIGILIALLLPAVQAAREAARRTQCTSQLKQVGLAVQNYHDVQGAYPAGRTTSDQFGVSWAFLILPYLEEQSVYDARNEQLRVDDPQNAGAFRVPIEVYACPSRRPAAASRDFDNDDAPPAPEARGVATLGDYAANAGLEENTGMEGNTSDPEDEQRDFTRFGVDKTQAGPMFSGSSIKARHVIDGLSKTLAVGERHLRPIQDDWSGDQTHYRQGDTCFLSGDHIETVMRGTEDGLATSDQDGSDQKFGGPHPGVTLFVFLDGHTEPLANSSPLTALGVNPNNAPDIRMDEEWLWLMAMSTVAGEEILQE